ncbi:Dabb family protein [Rhodohalobacter sp. 8-1]|uniref:Dabb family protein n=1 Tax=Rhodohalobacter sp. 8-1 TaxID=3131972 RepID=UPI0030EB2453
MKTLKTVFSLMLLGTIFTGCQQPEDTTTETMISTTENTTGMLQHTVYFYLNDDVTDQQRDEFESGLKDLLEIESIYKFELGVPGDTESRDVTDHSFAYSIFTWFENMDDYKTYDEHPDHLQFIDTYSSLWADVKVYDSELIEK